MSKPSYVKFHMRRAALCVARDFEGSPDDPPDEPLTAEDFMHHHEDLCWAVCYLLTWLLTEAKPAPCPDCQDLRMFGEDDGFYDHNPLCEKCLEAHE